MAISNAISQDPHPGRKILRFGGDVETFTLAIDDDRPGSAWLRTNIGHGHIRHREIIAEVHHGTPPLGHDWFDIPMKPTAHRRFEVRVALCETGHFEAKAFFLPEGRTKPLWAPGPNTVINVEPADTCCANIIYNAFVRQFGPNKDGRFRDPSREPFIKRLDESGYTVIPPSGTFRDLIGRLDFIIGTLGCRFLHLLPVHPTPTTYARMGRFGSPYAALNFKSVDPALAVFDPGATPMEQFIELVDAVHSRGARILMDIAINHTGWAANLHDIHPEWLVRDPEGRIEAPGAWGVTWADLTRLDYSHKRLWRYMADVFMTWCRRGVDGFRCDAGYMIPVATWKYIVAKVREQFPDTIFLLEGLGGPMAVTRELLDSANLNWAYSELFQNYDRHQIEAYLPEPLDISASQGLMVNYAETHDNERLAARSTGYAKMRTALCALFAHQGAFAFANGVEWHATEKIDVHQAASLNWGAGDNQVREIGRLSAILTRHPAFFDRTENRLIQEGDGNHLALLRRHRPSNRRLLILVNLDDQNSTRVSWRLATAGMQSAPVFDLIGGDEVKIETGDGKGHRLLEAGQVLCLSDDPGDLEMLEAKPAGHGLPGRILKQRLRAKALEVYRFYHPSGAVEDFDPDRGIQALHQDPEAFCRVMNPTGPESRVITWRWPRDEHRAVMVPPGHFLMVDSPVPFRARIAAHLRILAQEDCLPSPGGGFFALFAPLKTPAVHRRHRLKLVLHTRKGGRHVDGELLYLADPGRVSIADAYSQRQVRRQRRIYLATNGRGAMLRAAVFWGELYSRYDALLAANLSPEFPEDRWIMLTRCRAWVSYQGYSQEIGKDCLDAHGVQPGTGAWWRFRVPTGQGQHIVLTIALGLAPGANAVLMVFHRDHSGDQKDRLADDQAVRLILRPDIEDRNFHHNTKAYTGPEYAWPGAVALRKRGFSFEPFPGRRLTVTSTSGEFVSEPEWHYMVHRPLEAQRGQDPDSDLFSPGYVAINLGGGQTERLTAAIPDSSGIPPEFSSDLARLVTASQEVPPRRRPLVETLGESLTQFVVRRGAFKSVVAGYPWFLDWGRDSLIVVRGLIATGKTEEAVAILHQFGRFEQDGTLPNMIRGDHAGDRDTSDAPLWFFTACADLLAAHENHEALNALCGERTLREILVSMGHALCGTLPNGVRMDPDSALIYSPIHYTWMDTNHPAGTPRQGYPIEIQALWHAALMLLAGIDDTEKHRKWQKLAARVRESIMACFYRADLKYLSDCLHAEPQTAASEAEADDALRPNQLLAITLGAVDDKEIGRGILAACQELLVPGGIRSLSNRPVRRPLPVHSHGRLINDPHNPYQGRYQGDEDTQRKPAYHNGTAWTWMFPSFCEAWAQVYGDSARTTARAWLSSAARLVSEGCIGHVPEILDGDSPHYQRGCDAQAWGASELVRVWLKIAD